MALKLVMFCDFSNLRNLVWALHQITPSKISVSLDLTWQCMKEATKTNVSFISRKWFYSWVPILRRLGGIAVIWKRVFVKS